MYSIVYTFYPKNVYSNFWCIECHYLVEKSKTLLPETKAIDMMNRLRNIMYIYTYIHTHKYVGEKEKEYHIWQHQFINTVDK